MEEVNEDWRKQLPYESDSLLYYLSIIKILV